MCRAVSVILAQGFEVCGIVVVGQHVAHEFPPLPVFDEPAPRVDDFVAAQGEEVGNLFQQDFRRIQEMVIFLDQQRDTLFDAGVNPDALPAAHGRQQGIGNAQLADFLAFGFDKDWLGRIKLF